MTCLQTLYIPPKPASNSTIPLEITSLPIHPISLWQVGAIPSVLGFPSLLDVGKLWLSVKELGGLWPNICGRYVKKPRIGSDGEWDFAIDLTSRPIPCSSQSITLPSSEVPQLTPLPNTNVVQANLASYVPPLGENYFTPNSDSHLFAVRLTTILPSNQSVLGINFAHILGDGSACNALIRCLSDCYTRSTTSLGASFIPSFFPHIQLAEYPPSEATMKEFKLCQLDAHELSSMREAYGAAAKRSEMMTVKITRKEMKALRDLCKFDKDERLSDQDILSGWWTTILERSGTEVERMVYTVNYRTLHPDHTAFPPNLPTLSANVAQMRAIPVPITEGSKNNHEIQLERIKTIARGIRAELNRLRSDPNLTLRWLSNAAWHIEQAAINGRGHVMVPAEREILVNSNLRYQWNISFGFPSDEVHFHTSFSTYRFLRVFQANPRLGEKAGETDIELVFNVENVEGSRETVERIVEGDKARFRIAIA